eukprot:gene19320-21969_t
MSKSDSNNEMSSASNLNAGASVFVPGTNEWKIPAKNLAASYSEGGGETSFLPGQLLTPASHGGQTPDTNNGSNAEQDNGSHRLELNTHSSCVHGDVVADITPTMHYQAVASTPTPPRPADDATNEWSVVHSRRKKKTSVCEAPKMSTPSTHNQRNLVCNSIFSPELLADADDDMDSVDLLAFVGPIPSTPITKATHTSISTSTITKTNSNMGRSLANEEQGGPVPANLTLSFQSVSSQCAVESPTRALAAEGGAKVVSGENTRASAADQIESADKSSFGHNSAGESGDEIHGNEDDVDLYETVKQLSIHSNTVKSNSTDSTNSIDVSDTAENIEIVEIVEAVEDVGDLHIGQAPSRSSSLDGADCDDDTFAALYGPSRAINNIDAAEEKGVEANGAENSEEVSEGSDNNDGEEEEDSCTVESEEIEDAEEEEEIVDEDSTYDTADHTGSEDAGSEGCASDGDEVEEGEEVDEEEGDGEGDWGGDAEHSEYEEEDFEIEEREDVKQCRWSRGIEGVIYTFFDLTAKKAQEEATSSVRSAFATAEEGQMQYFVYRVFEKYSLIYGEGWLATYMNMLTSLSSAEPALLTWEDATAAALQYLHLMHVTQLTQMPPQGLAERTSQFLYELMRSRLLQIDSILQYAESNTSSSAQRAARLTLVAIFGEVDVKKGDSEKTIEKKRRLRKRWYAPTDPTAL